MNTISKRRWLSSALGLFALGACLQGPWDYYPKNPSTFKGIYVNGYVLATRPVAQFCLERILDLSEEATQAYAFYDSADVRITGPFSGATATQILTAKDSTPNCFTGDPAMLAELGGTYALEARVVWDSAGRQVVSMITGTARIPSKFSIRDSATAPSFANPKVVKEGGGLPTNILSPEFYALLSDELKAVFKPEFDALSELTESGDTAALALYIAKNSKTITDRMLALLKKENFVYHEGDTLTYLSGDLNILSHYFTSDRSPDVGAVLVTHQYERTSSRPETRFDAPIGDKPKPYEYYYPGEIHSLLAYPDAKGPDGFHLLDSIGFVNVFFHTQLNTIYFYGFEQPYYAYLRTVTQVETGSEGDPRIKPIYNVKGAIGFFVGGVPDTFHVNIELDSASTIGYPLPIVHALHCKEEGWGSEKDCREFLRPYCSGNGWSTGDCRVDAVKACLEAKAAGGVDSLKAMCDSLDAPGGRDSLTTYFAQVFYCVERNFPDTTDVCDGPRTECLETGGANGCKRVLWDYCLDNFWRPEQCRPGVASYCHDRPRLSEPLCKQADIYCAANAGSVLCK